MIAFLKNRKKIYKIVYSQMLIKACFILLSTRMYIFIGIMHIGNFVKKRLPGTISESTGSFIF